MKQKTLLLYFMLLPLAAYAQSEEKTVTLDEVTVQGARMVNTVDGLVIYPTEVQKSASKDGYSMLNKLALPNIRIDEISHAVSAIDDKGAVQIRIDGIVMGRNEMLMLNPGTITHIEFIDNPGLRYGEGIAYVINIHTRREDSGYTIGANAVSAVTTVSANGAVYGKWNKGRSELSLSYDVGGYRTKGVKSEETADYTLTDGSVHTISRNDFDTMNKSISHDAKLTYNYADSTATVFNVSLSGSFSNAPGNYANRNIIDGSTAYTASSATDQQSQSPVLDLYFFRQMTPRQSLTMNVVGTYIRSKLSSRNDEGTVYQYDVSGKTYSVMSELIYETRLKPFTVSAGVNYKYKYTNNEYTGDAAAQNILRNNDVYLFAEMKGSWKRLRYSAGLGVSYLHYQQGEHKYNNWLFRPKATLNYDLGKGFTVRYSYRMWDAVSRIAMINDAVIRINSMEWKAGNPNLKPSRDMDHGLRLSYSNSRWQTFIEGYYKNCHQPNMAHYERTADNRFIYTQINQKEISMLRLSLYANCWVVKDKLSLSAYGGLQRCFNYGDDYTHCYTSGFCTFSAEAYLGDFTLQAYYDNGNRWLEGETRGYSAGSTVLTGSYSHKNWSFALFYEQPLYGNYKVHEGELINRNIHKLTSVYNSAKSNTVSLKITYRFEHGRKYKSAEKKITLRDSDAGILKD
ncbi:MAG: TonB-dependent receptor [Bacteroidaceae bacterium]|nr:TonB-dependent receptor [Bacteroidaceae bacterium]